MTFDDPVKALAWLIDTSKGDNELKYVMVGIADRHGYPDFFAYAEANPDMVVQIAEQYADVVDQDLPVDL